MITKNLLMILSLLLAGCAAPSADAKPKKENQLVHTSLPSGKVLAFETAEIIPTVIHIPSIGVNAPVEKVGTLQNGQMDVPEHVDSAGWYEPGTKPGGHGNSVIAGHVDSETGPAIFYKLDQLKENDLIELKGEDGSTLTFRVYGSESFPRHEAPVDEIFGFTYRKTLNLITCTGEFNHSERTHEERLVVYAELVEEK